MSVGGSCAWQPAFCRAFGPSAGASPKAGTKATWVPEEFLATQWKQEELDFPPWAPMKGETAGFSLTDASRAARTGLKCRPLKTTVNDTLEWFKTLPPERQAKLRAGIPRCRGR